MPTKNLTHTILNVKFIHHPSETPPTHLLISMHSVQPTDHHLPAEADFLSSDPAHNRQDLKDILPGHHIPAAAAVAAAVDPEVAEVAHSLMEQPIVHIAAAAASASSHRTVDSVAARRIVGVRVERSDHKHWGCSFDCCWRPRRLTR